MKSLKYSWLCLLFVIATAPGAFAHGAKTVTVTNDSTYNMTELYASPSVDSDWDTTSNLLAGRSIPAGQTGTITIADGLDHCHYDLMGVLYGAAAHAYEYRVDACEGGSWTISQ